RPGRTLKGDEPRIIHACTRGAPSPQAPDLASQQGRANARVRGKGVLRIWCLIDHSSLIASRYDTERIWDKPESNSFRLAQVLPVYMEGDRPLGRERELRECRGAYHVAPGWQLLLRGVHHAAERRQRRQRAQPPQCEQVEAGIEVGVRCGANRMAAQVCPRRA